MLHLSTVADAKNNSRTWVKFRSAGWVKFLSAQTVWFNQAHLFHISSLDTDMREALVDAVGEEYLPRNVYYGDGSPIDDATLEHVRTVLGRHKVAFSWRAGDVLMLDNMLAAHARSPFKGKRKVVVAMAEAHGINVSA